MRLDYNLHYLVKTYNDGVKYCSLPNEMRENEFLFIFVKSNYPLKSTKLLESQKFKDKLFYKYREYEEPDPEILKLMKEMEEKRNEF
jgi:hypothetical protein